jgi:S-adenosylmethionine/arginine decarboxylase-like enzyme
MFDLSGAPGRIRTSDPQVRSLVLYPTELRAHLSVSTCGVSTCVTNRAAKYLLIQRESQRIFSVLTKIGSD